MMESGPPTTLNRTEILASHTGMLSTHTSPLHARRESSLSAIENNGLTKRERESGVFLLHSGIQAHSKQHKLWL